MGIFGLSVVQRQTLSIVTVGVGFFHRSGLVGGHIVGYRTPAGFYRAGEKLAEAHGQSTIFSLGFAGLGGSLLVAN